MKHIAIGILLIAVVALPNIRVVAVTQAGAKSPSLAEAERAWELAIQAKGGRDRLQKIDNLHMSVREKYWGTLRRLTMIQENLYVFPGKSWEWNDQRGTMFGFSIRMHNFESNTHLSYVGYGTNRAVVPILNPSQLTLLRLQANLLMETKWLKPIPQGLRKATLGKREVDIVATLIQDPDGGTKKVEFALDSLTHLPVEVIYYDLVRPGKELVGGIFLSEYVEVDGIQMPSKIGGVKATYQFNVDFDTRIFVEPPSFSAGLDAWKKKG